MSDKVGFRNGCLVARNISFDYTETPQPADPSIISEDGQLLIGSIESHPDIAMQAGNLLSSTFTIAYSDPNITVNTKGGGQPIETINSIGPTVGGNFTINAGSNITITPGANSISIASSAAASFTWVQISASQALAKNTGYFCVSPGGALSLSLPTTASSTIGDIIEVTLDGATSWTITQAASQQIRFSGSQTTAGVGGSLASTAAGDTIRMVYQAAGKWNVISSCGNLTVT